MWEAVLLNPLLPFCLGYLLVPLAPPSPSHQPGLAKAGQAKLKRNARQPTCPPTATWQQREQSAKKGKKRPSHWSWRGESSRGSASRNASHQSASASDAEPPHPSIHPSIHPPVHSFIPPPTPLSRTRRSCFSDWIW
ncbi:hypothetical protein BT67DRAFT_144830 [Trichocladium antarcticum]|uniref:Secreted protein n=1 Tax=Trichocladium antarcticum TaxID=1450529 RepID=A0AAN6UFB0_9PEZI|nr:hypothetical protein BT67DRAFT_144830 [Trichocladium antarcticum]